MPAPIRFCGGQSMSKHKAASLPTPFSKVVKRLETWRRQSRPRARLPEDLWSSAVALARRYGLHKTAKALRLDYYGLKKRVEQTDKGTRTTETRADTFVGVLPSELSPLRPECMLEMENASGSKLRIQLKGFEAPDLPGCLAAFGEIATKRTQRSRRLPG
jgi:hypothetical protein